MANNEKTSRESKKPGKSLLEKRAAKQAKSTENAATRAAAASLRKP
jgi:hypothetical protein